MNQMISSISAAAVIHATETTAAVPRLSVGLARQSTAEQMFRIGSRLKMALKPSEQIIACTGVSQDDPSESFAVHAAMALARLGHGPVLLVDANFHRRLDPKRLVSQSVGFADLLTDESRLDGAVRCTDVEGLDVLTAGDTASVVPAILSSARMDQVIESFRSYRLVVMDVGAILDNSECQVMAAKADVIVATAVAGERSRRDVERLKAEIDLLRTSFLGVVLTGVK
ncbi:hypothetical protein BH10ACI4_BH10ACI4_24510 [soil metagenome]